MNGHVCLVYLNVSMFLVASLHGVYLQGTGGSFLQYPHWHACQNASLSFDLRTLVSDALLLYSDDGGHFAFVSILLKSGQVSVKVNFVQDPDHHAVHLYVNRTVNDGLWHTVLLRRNRMETILAVDGVSDSRYALGVSGEHFGKSPTDSFVYIGGLPISYWQDMNTLTVPSAIYAQRLNGDVRNVIYNNCTCMRLRAGQPMTGEGFAVMTSDLACERHNCSRSCLCITTDMDYACDCTERACFADVVSHYEIPMDVALFDGAIANPSALNVMVINSAPVLVPGLNGLAAHIGFNNSYIIVDTVQLKSDCFGDFQKCHMGFTIMLSLKMLICPINTEAVILSTDLNLNLSVMNLVYTSSSSLTFCYHRLPGQLWCVSCHDVSVGHWHQIAVTWHTVTGLAVYLNGHLADSVGTIQNSLKATDYNYKQLYLGHPNNTCQFLVDNVNFWSQAVNHTEVREKGVLFCITLSMELKNTNLITESGFKMIAHGHPKQVDGKVGKAIMFENVNQFLVSDDDQALQCLVNLVHCQHGLMISAWMFWTHLQNASHYYDSGCRGLQMFATGEQITVVATAGFLQWTVSWSSPTVNHWYFVEISWSIEDGLEMYIDHKLISSSQIPKAVSDRDLDGSMRLYIGRASRPNSQQPLITGFILDELHICYGSIRILTNFGFLHRGRPYHYMFSMDTIHGDLMPHSSLSIHVHGNGIAKPITVPGKISNATRLDGDSQFIVIDGLNDSCLQHLLSCSQHGFLISTWLKFRRLDNGMYYLSTGDGIKIFYGDGCLVFETSIHNKKWVVMVYGIQLETWYFTEVTWTARTGLFVYINGHLSGQQTKPTYTTRRTRTGRLLIGYADDAEPLQPVHFGDFIIDQTEIWLQDRNTLIAFNYIARGNITHLMITFDELQTEESFTVKFSKGGRLVSGRQNNSLQLISGQSASIESMKDGSTCLGDIHLFNCGITIAFHVFITDMTQSIPLLTSNSIKVQAMSNGHLEVHFVKEKMRWLAVTKFQSISVNNWHHIELSWHEDKGIQVFIDKTCKASTNEGIETNLSIDASFNCSLHVGWLNNDTTQISSTVLIDDIEVWFADRDHLQAFGFLEDDVSYVLLDMEHISNDLLTHPTHVIYVHGSPRTVPSQHGTGVLLNGLNQYLDAGKDIACKNNLNNCPKGFTLRFKIKPYQLADLTYFISSAPIDVYYRNCLIAEVRTPNKQWLVSSVDFETHSWQQVDVSWHSADGLVLYINGMMVDKDTESATNEVDYNSSWRFLIGRANSDMRRENFANAVFDDVQFWETTRQVIVMMGFIKDLNEMNMNRSTVSRKRSVVTTPATVRPVQYLHGNHVPATAISYYVQIPTGRPIRKITVNSQNVILPTLPPSMKKKLVFDSSAFIKYDLSLLPESYQTTNLFQQMYIKFQTVEPNGLLWHSGNDQQNINLSLKNGALLLAVYYGEERKSDKFKIATNQRLDDNEWHDVYLTLRHKQITVMVDDMEFPKSLMAEIQLMSENGSLYVAGSDNTALLTHDNMRNNFRGTVDKVILTGDSLPSDINFFDLTLIKPTPEYVEIYGNVISVLSGAAAETIGETAAITFTEINSYIRLPLWDARQSGSIEFFFKTVEPHALLVYTGGKQGQKDFFAVELYDGVAYLIIDLGDRVHRFTVCKQPLYVSDGIPHHMKITRHRNTLRLMLDADEYSENIVSAQSTLNLGTFLFIGAVDNPARLPWHLWTRDYKFFIGCIWGVRINNGDVQDLPRLAVEQYVAGVEIGCKTKPLACSHPQCSHGRCSDRWKGFVCLCHNTSFRGELCQKEAPLMAYTGNQMSFVAFHPAHKTHTNDVSVRFKTPKDNGIVFKAGKQGSDDHLKVYIERGILKLETNIGGLMQSPFQMTLRCDTKLNNDQWHTLYVRRRANYLEGSVDACEPVTADIPGEGYTLNIDFIAIADMAVDTMSSDAFVGHMQNMFFDDIDLFDIIRQYLMENSNFSSSSVSVVNSGELTSVEKQIPVHTVTIRAARGSLVTLPPLNLTYGNASLKFMFKTLLHNALLMYSEGATPDYIGVELVDGQLKVSANDGAGNMSVATQKTSLSDGQWHLVDIRQITTKAFTIRVDDELLNLTLQPGRYVFELMQPVQLGGLLHDTDSLSTYRSFSGCLATITADEVLYDLSTSSASITPGCLNISGHCLSDTCQHGGICMENFAFFQCDCNLTSFVGSTCSDEANGYYFGPESGHGLVVFILTTSYATTTDRIAFGFMTWHPNATLMRVSSGSSADYMDIKLVRLFKQIIALYH